MYLTKKKIQDACVKYIWTDFTTILKLVKMLRKLHLSVNPSFHFSTLLFVFENRPSRCTKGEERSKSLIKSVLKL